MTKDDAKEMALVLTATITIALLIVMVSIWLFIKAVWLLAAFVGVGLIYLISYWFYSRKVDEDV